MCVYEYLWCDICKILVLHVRSKTPWSLPSPDPTARRGQHPNPEFPIPMPTIPLISQRTRHNSISVSHAREANLASSSSLYIISCWLFIHIHHINRRHYAIVALSNISSILFLQYERSNILSEVFTMSLVASLRVEIVLPYPFSIFLSPPSRAIR